MSCFGSRACRSSTTIPTRCCRHVGVLPRAAHRHRAPHPLALVAARPLLCHQRRRARHHGRQRHQQRLSPRDARRQHARLSGVSRRLALAHAEHQGRAVLARLRQRLESVRHRVGDRQWAPTRATISAAAQCASSSPAGSGRRRTTTIPTPICCRAWCASAFASTRATNRATRWRPRVQGRRALRGVGAIQIRGHCRHCRCGSGDSGDCRLHCVVAMHCGAKQEEESDELKTKRNKSPLRL
jgi:hypothetical protein